MWCDSPQGVLGSPNWSRYHRTNWFGVSSNSEREEETQPPSFCRSEEHRLKNQFVVSVQIRCLKMPCLATGSCYQTYIFLPNLEQDGGRICWESVEDGRPQSHSAILRTALSII